MKATVGRIVHLVMNDGAVRPMIVTAVFGGDTSPESVAGGGGMINGTVFLDGGNDLNKRDGVAENNVPSGLDVLDGTSVARGWSREYSDKNEPGTWHWPERVQEKACSDESKA